MPGDVNATTHEGLGAAAREIRSLTGLRGVAASLVMLYHFTATTMGSGPLSTFVRKGYIWVDLFFVLSGFIMALSFAHTFSSNGVGSWRAYWPFLTRRLARIYPLYLLVTVESIFASLKSTLPGLDADAFPSAVAANIVMVQAWGIAPSFEGAAWSISTEWAAYLLFPCLLGLTLFRGHRIAVAFGLLCLATIALLGFLPGMRFDGQSRMGPLDIYSSASLAPLLRCLAEFSLGLLAYRWFRGISARTVQHDRCGRWSLTLTVLILSGMTIPDADVVVVAFFPLLIASLAQQTGPVSLFLASNVPVWLGEVSYSIYLLHGKFVRVVDWGDEALQPLGSVAHPTSVFLTILLVCACATVIHHSVERPCRILVRTAFERPGRRWRRRTVKANVVPLTAEPREG